MVSSMTHGMHAHAFQFRTGGLMFFHPIAATTDAKVLVVQLFACGYRHLDLRMNAQLPCSHVEPASRPPLNTGMAHVQNVFADVQQR